MSCANEPIVLVVDDEPVVCQACDRVLSRQGFAVETVNDPQEGLRRALQAPVIALLLDVKMPTMDGITFLQALRREKPDLPVVVMTGYPTIQNAAAAVRLGAKDYVVKPFTPEEITRALRDALRGTEGAASPRAACVGELGAGEDGEGAQAARERYFYEKAWFQRDRQGEAVCGTIRPAGGLASPSEVRLPRLGEVVYQGLPLAAVRCGDAAAWTVPAPLTGVVVAVNEALARDAALLGQDPFAAGWLATLSPTRLDEELPRCTRRQVVALVADEAAAVPLRRQLQAGGCELQVTTQWQALVQAVAQHTPGLVVLHAAPLGGHGPGQVAHLRTMAPAAKLMIVGPSPNALEAAYRAEKIFYYAVEPITEAEWLTVIDSAFRPQRASGEGQVSTTPPAGESPAIQQLLITNRQGRRVCLVAVSAVLQRDAGLAKVLRQRLLERLFPLETQLGGRELSQADIADLATRFDRVVVLVAQDSGRLPGSLVRDTKETYVALSGKEENNVFTLAIQPSAQPGEPLSFDARTTEVLAELIAAELAAA